MKYKNAVKVLEARQRAWDAMSQQNKNATTRPGAVKTH